MSIFHNSKRGGKIDVVNDIFRVVDPSFDILIGDINIVAVDWQFMKNGYDCILWNYVWVDGIGMKIVGLLEIELEVVGEGS